MKPKNDARSRASRQHHQQPSIPMKLSSFPVRAPRDTPMLQSRGPMDGKRRNFALMACICLALAILTVYSRAARNPFLHVDDQNYVTENPDVQAGLTWHTFTWAF